MGSPKARKLTHEEEMRASGNCYEAAMLYALSHAKKNTMVVHGYITPRRGVWTSSKGDRAWNVEIDHAWVEIGNKIFDASHDVSPKPFSKDEYYKTFNVNKTKLKKYSVDEANLKTIVNHDFGPWED